MKTLIFPVQVVGHGRKYLRAMSGRQAERVARSMFQAPAFADEPLGHMTPRWLGAAGYDIAVVTSDYPEPRSGYMSRKAAVNAAKVGGEALRMLAGIV